MTFEYANWPPGQPHLPSPLPTDFKLTTSPGTDIWRKPPQHDAFNAPILYRSIKLSAFRRARVTVFADWKTLYDQGGLCLVLPQATGSLPKWIKTGVETFNGNPHVSTVACDRWADWSLFPMSGATATVEMEREVVDGKPTSTLWVYVLEGLEPRPAREVSWVFDRVEDRDSGDCWIGVYVAKPTKDEDDGSRALQVLFSHLVIETF